MTSQVAPGRVASTGRRVGGLAARLTALSVLAFASSLATGALATAALVDVRATGHAEARIDQLVDAQISVDELAESLRGDVLARRLGLLVDAHDAADDVLELQRQSLLIAAADGTELRRLGTDEYSYAVRSQQLLTGRAPDATELSGYLDLGNHLRARVDAARADLAAEKAREAVASDAQLRTAVGRSAAAAVTVAILVFTVGWWIRGRLLGSLSRLAEVARAVAGGDLAARTGFSASDEVGELAGVLDEMAAATQKAFAELDADAGRQDFRARFDRALAQVDTDAELADTVSRTLEVIDPALPVELLIADSSEAHLTRYAINPSAGAPGCTVGTPWSCPAVRGGRTTSFPDSQAIDACPHLRHRDAGPRSGVCMPVSFMGRVLGVLHAAGEPARLPCPEQMSRLQTVAEQTGTRLGTMRAFDRVQQQASLDGLTGLANRRSFENSVHALTRSGRPYGLLLADLDHFKSVNDTYGHAAGDRALRLFADVLRTCLRTDDLACRYGGEEFAVLLPGADAPTAAETADRLRAALYQAVSGGDGPAFTVSLGAADSTMAGSLPAQLAIADTALLAAKRDGRDRCVLASASTPALPTLPTQPRARPANHAHATAETGAGSTALAAASLTPVISRVPERP